MTKLPPIYLHEGDALNIIERFANGNRSGTLTAMLSTVRFDAYPVRLAVVSECQTCRHADGLGSVAALCLFDPTAPKAIRADGTGFCCWREAKLA